MGARIMARVRKYNPYHDSGGRFATSGGSKVPGTGGYPMWKMEPDPHVQATEAAYIAEHGLPPAPPYDYKNIGRDENVSKRVADDFDALPKVDRSPETLAAYSAFRDEVAAQKKAMNDSGVRIEYHDVDPYPGPLGYLKMHDDVVNHGVMKVLNTHGHPFLSDREYTDFRAVHDYFGHIAVGRGFDRHGEEAAWLAHMTMFGDPARKALVTETRGQNTSLSKHGVAQPYKMALLPPRDAIVPTGKRLTTKAMDDVLKGAVVNLDAHGYNPFDTPDPRECICAVSGHVHRPLDEEDAARMKWGDIDHATNVLRKAGALDGSVSVRKFNQHHANDGRFSSSGGGGGGAGAGGGGGIGSSLAAQDFRAGQPIVVKTKDGHTVEGQVKGYSGSASNRDPKGGVLDIHVTRDGKDGVERYGFDEIDSVARPTTKAVEPLLVDVTKSVEEKRFTFGPLYMPGQLDAHKEFTTAETLQTALWDYVAKTGSDRTIFLQHTKVPAGEWVEAAVWPYEAKVQLGIPGQDSVAKSATREVTLPANTAYLGVRWKPWAWSLVKSGKLKGYSLGGKAKHVEVEFTEQPEALS